MKNVKLARGLGILGFILMIPVFLLVLFAQSLLDMVGVEVVGWVLFLLLNLPTLVGLLATFFLRKLPKITGFLLFLSGLTLIVPGLLFGTVFLGLITGVLYLVSGSLMLWGRK